MLVALIVMVVILRRCPAQEMDRARPSSLSPATYR